MGSNYKRIQELMQRQAYDGEMATALAVASLADAVLQVAAAIRESNGEPAEDEEATLD